MSAPNPYRVLAARPDFYDHAACKGWPVGWWHPERGDTNVTKAKAICNDCPVQTDCLQWAIDNDEIMGIWGGVSINQWRRQQRRLVNPGRRRPAGSGRAPEPIIHGTLGGYAKERRRQLEPCDACREANRLYHLEAKRARRRTA